MAKTDACVALLSQTRMMQTIVLIWWQLLTKQTRVGSPTPCSTNPPTLGCGEGKCRVYCKSQAKSPELQTPKLPEGFQGQSFKDREGVVSCISSVQSLSHVWLFETPWIAASQAFLSITNSPEFAQTHVHWVSDATQPPHPLSSPYVLYIISS